MDEKLRILLCEDDENLGMLLRENICRQKATRPNFARMVRLATRLSLRTNTTYVYWM